MAVRARDTERDFESITPASGFNQEIRATSSHLVRIQYPIGFGVTNDDESQVDEIAFRDGALESSRIKAPPGYAFHGSELEIYGDRAYAIARKDSEVCLASWKLGDDRMATLHDCYPEGLEHLTAGAAGLTARIGGDGETGKTISLVGNAVPESLTASARVYPMEAEAYVVGDSGTESHELRLVDSTGATTVGTIARDTHPVACAGSLWFIGPVDGASSLMRVDGATPTPVNSSSSKQSSTGASMVLCAGDRVLTDNGEAFPTPNGQ